MWSCTYRSWYMRYGTVYCLLLVMSRLPVGVFFSLNNAYRAALRVRMGHRDPGSGFVDSAAASSRGAPGKNHFLCLIYFLESLPRATLYYISSASYVSTQCCCCFAESRIPYACIRIHRIIPDIWSSVLLRVLGFGYF